MLSTLDYVNVAVTLAVVASYGYVFYAAMLVRRTLAVGLYRRHAFGIGLLAAVFAFDQVSNFLPTDGVWGLIGLVGFAVFALGLLYWVDSSILAARRSDPLYRDTLHWSGLRKVIWAVSVGALVFVFLASIALPPSFGDGSTPTGGPMLWFTVAFSVLFFFPIYSAAVSGVVVMPIAARRCKDLVFRSHLEWLFLFIAIQLVAAGVIGQVIQSPFGNSDPLAWLVDGLGLLVGLFPLYRSVKRLVPLYRFAAEQPAGQKLS
jgi:hypothetical protein